MRTGMASSTFQSSCRCVPRMCCRATNDRRSTAPAPAADACRVAWQMLARIESGELELAGFSDLLHALHTTPLSLLEQEARQRALSVRFAPVGGEELGEPSVAGEFVMQLELTGKWPHLRGTLLVQPHETRRFMGRGGSSHAAKTAAAAAALRAMPPHLPGLEHPPGALPLAWIRWFRTNVCRNVPAATLLHALVAKGFVPHRCPAIMHYLLARRELQEFFDAHPYVPHVSKVRHASEPVVQLVDTLVAAGMDSVTLLDVLLEVGMREESNPALVRRLRDVSGSAERPMHASQLAPPLASTSALISSRFTLPARARLNDVQGVQWFLAAGADPNAPHAGHLPLAAAVETSARDTVRALLAAGASVSARDEFGRTPLHRAVVSGSAELVELLGMYGAPITAADRYGDTPVHAAAAVGNSSAIAWMAAYQADRARQLTRAGEFARRVEAEFSRFIATRVPDYRKQAFAREWAPEVAVAVFEQVGASEGQQSPT